MTATPTRWTRRELLRLAAAAGAAGALPISASANGVTAGPKCVSNDNTAAAERIGKQLWSAFRQGAKLEVVPKDVEEAGRMLSGPHICHNLDQLGGEKNFPLGKTRKCAFAAGVEARRLATDEGHAEITAKNFEDAWNTISHQVHEAAERLQRIFGTKVILGGGC